MGHPDFVYIGKGKGDFYRRFLMDGIQLMIDIPAWFLKKREIHS
jgi:hypothetical protein